jgi:hypothetical protein
VPLFQAMHPIGLILQGSGRYHPLTGGEKEGRTPTGFQALPVFETGAAAICRLVSPGEGGVRVELTASCPTSNGLTGRLASRDDLALEGSPTPGPGCEQAQRVPSKGFEPPTLRSVI